MLRKKTKIILITCILTAIAIFISLNFVGHEKQVDKKIPRLYSTSDPQFTRAMGALLGPAIVNGNQTQELLNGDQIFPAMLKAIREAQKTITFETYIYWSGEIGKEFADALSERARAGVKVHVLLDWVGSSKMDDSLLDEMRSAGVAIEKYHPLHWYSISRLNNRTHRKLLVVDGKIGFTGGVGIADIWTGNAQDPKHWRDTHFRVEGPAVAQMQATFLDNWIKVRGEVLHGEAYFPAIPKSGDHLAQVFMSSPTGGSESMHMMYLLSITAAKDSILISNSYFVPDELTIRTMVDALKRGVKIKMILPGEHTDTEIVRGASRSTWGELLRAGAEIYEYKPTMYHCKVMIVDGVWVSVGSTNFDNRSFSLNDEANLNVYNADFAKRQIAVFEEDLKRSRRITLSEWENRPWHQKLWENTIALFNSQF